MVNGRRPVRHFCTYGDENYLPQIFSMLDSLRRHSTPFHLQILCLTWEALRCAQSLKGDDFSLVSLKEIENSDPELRSTKENRSRIEYYFTCTPCWIRYALKREQGTDLITYLDADLYFYNSPEPIFTRMKGYSVGITPHRFPKRLTYLEVNGKFNVGWVSIRRDPSGMSCLEDWRKKCLEWCFDRVESGRYGDQKYLDNWPCEFHGVKIIDHPGVNLAMWNFETVVLKHQGGNIHANGEPLIFYHFSGLKQLKSRLYDPQWTQYGIRPCKVLRQSVYKPYLKKLELTRKLLNINKILTSVRSNDSDQKKLKLGVWKTLRRCLRGDYLSA
jgi:hypothetical protein